MKPVFCPRCGNLIVKREKVCPRCGTPIVRESKSDASDAEELTNKRRAEVESKVVVSENMSAAKREQLEKEKQKQAKQEAAADLQMSKTKQKKLAKDKAKAKKKKTYKHKKVQVFEARDDGEGGIKIDVSDSSFLDETKHLGTNVKTSDGQKKKYKIPEKLKWYDVAKWADRMLARRKVKRAVNKAGTEIPDYVSKPAMIVLCVLFGYMGAHSFYAKNYVRACVSLFSVIISSVVISIDVLTKYVGVSIGGGFGLVFVVMWLWDLFAIIFNKYIYRTSKNKFIATLNFDTRAILGRKYIKKEIAEMEQNEQENK